MPRFGPFTNRATHGEPSLTRRHLWGRIQYGDTCGAASSTATLVEPRWSKSCEISLRYSVPTAKNAITRTRRTRKSTQTDWKRRNIARAVGTTPFIARRSRYKDRANLLQSFALEFSESRPVAPTGRAPVSKTGCWGFDSLLACLTNSRRLQAKSLTRTLILQTRRR